MNAVTLAHLNLYVLTLAPILVSIPSTLCTSFFSNPFSATLSPKLVRPEMLLSCSLACDYADKILLIKETSVCNYVLVIHTPRLCGEPGFKSERASQDESVLRCRQVLPDEEYAAEQAALIAASPSSNEQKHMTKAGSSSSSGDSTIVIPYVESMHPFRIAPGSPERAAVPAPDPDTPVAQPAGAIEEGLGEGDGDNKDAAAPPKKPAMRDSTELIREAIRALLKGDDHSGDKIKAEGGDESTRTSESDKSATKSDDSEPKAGSKPADREGLIAELFGRDPQDVVTLQGDDGTASYIIIDNMEEVNDLAGLLGNAAAEGSNKRLDAIRKRLLEALKSIGNEAPDGKEGKQEDDGSSSSEDGVPATHDEL